MDLEFDCPQCKQHLAIDVKAAGTQTRCPTCGNTVPVPAAPIPTAQPISTSPVVQGEPSAPPPGIRPGIIYCTKCGQQNPENFHSCARCGAMLHEGSRPQYVVSDSGLGGLIPYRNAFALWAYYLGVFSLIPCFGIPLGIAAFITGIMGLRRANRQPQMGGKGHAWAGIILGLVSVIGQVAFIPIVLLIATKGFK